MRIAHTPATTQSGHEHRIWHCETLACLVCTVVVTTLLGARVNGQIIQTVFRAADGTAYQVIQADTSVGTDHTRVTTVSGSADGIGGCIISQSMPGGNAQAVVGVLQGSLQFLHPYVQIVRTAIMTTNIGNFSTDVTFDPAFGGRVTLGTGVDAKNVCKDTFDCTGELNVQSIVPLSSASGGVPAACIANGINAGCDQANLRNVFAFGIGSAGSPPTCNSAGDVTVNTRVCAAEPTDGFVLGAKDAVVFIYDSGLAASGFSVGSAGFGITGGAMAPCSAAGLVINAQAALITGPAPPDPTETPTGPSATPTVTPSPSPPPAPLCAASPRTGCRTAEKSGLFIRNNTGDAKDKLVWQWKRGAATDLFALGNPVTGATNYVFCLYGSSGGTPGVAFSALIRSAAMCGGTFCWSPAGTRGFGYRDPSGQADGVIKVLLRTGELGQARVLLRGKGDGLPHIAPANLNNLLSQDPVVTAQLLNSAGECWESVYAAPAKRVDGSSFRDGY